MTPNEKGLEFSYEDASMFFSILQTGAKEGRNYTADTSEFIRTVGNSVFYLGLGAPDVLRAADNRIEEWRLGRLRQAEKAGREPSATVKNYRLTHEDAERHLTKALALAEQAEVEVTIDPTTVTVPWGLQSRLGEACLFVLREPIEGLTWVDRSCGGFTMPGTQRTAYELVGQVSGAIAAYRGFLGYRSNNPYGRYARED